MALLFEALTIRSIRFSNRIVVSPMCQYSAEDGYANDWHLVHLGSRAVGGAGLVIVEATAVTPEGRISPGDLGIWKDEHISALARIAAFVEGQGSVPGIQLAHAGRKASHTPPWSGGRPLLPEEGAWQTVAPSALPFKAGGPVPEALTREAIHQIVGAFREGARRSLEAGFKVVEIHAAHGYLLNEFLSPLSNRRTDGYGGDFENRIRLLLEVVEAVRQVWPPAYPLFVRISATEWIEGGWTIEDSVQLASRLKERGVDLIDCSSGGNTPGASIPVAPLYQVPFAEQIRQKAGMATGAVGLITSAGEAEAILKGSRADLVFLGRQLLRDPFWPLKAAKELGVDLKWPLQYERAKA